MLKSRRNIALFFIGIILIMLSIESMPHIFNAYNSNVVDSSVPAYHNEHNNTEKGLFHIFYDLVAALSETHAHNQHEHNIIQDKTADNINPLLIFVFLFTSFIALECLLFMEKRKPVFQDIPILYKNYTPSTWALRGPPSIL